MFETGKYYHVFNRGNNRQNLFFEKRNYEHFLTLYQKYCNCVADTYAYCLMKNHFHLLICIREKEEITMISKTHEQKIVPDPTIQFRNFFISYAKSINKAYDRTGALFETPFKKIEIQSDVYFARLTHYIHYNPKKHNFVSDFTRYYHSSYHVLLSDEPTFLARNVVMQWFGGKKQFIEFHKNVAEEKEISLFIGNDEI